MGANKGRQLVADFDSGVGLNDALSALFGINGLGLSSSEGLISKCDSLGTAFIDSMVDGITSYSGHLSSPDSEPDIDSTSNSSFGEVAIWQRVSVNQQCIDQALRVRYESPLASLAAMKKTLNEGKSGTKPLYFEVQLNGYRLDPNLIVSLDYKTRNGSALSGQDYITTQGHLKLYPNENHALVLVAIIANTLSEEDETFYLDLFNPLNAVFGEGLVELTAVRTF